MVGWWGGAPFFSLTHISLSSLSLYAQGLSVEVACDGREAVDAVLAAHNAADSGSGGGARTSPDGGPAPTTATAPPPPPPPPGKQYDAILMDMSMPVLGGVAATAAIRGAGCGVPVIAMTANASDTDRDACLGAGMDGHLVKPVLPGRLAEALVLVLSGRARFQDATVALGPGL